VPTLLDRETGEPIVVAASELRQYLQSPRYALADETRFTDELSGQSVTLDQQAAQHALSRNVALAPESGASGFDLAREGQLEEQYGSGLGNDALALLAGGGRGISLGLSDLALKGILDDDGEFALEQLRKRNEVASIAGEVGGALLPALLTGGTTAGASAARIGLTTAARLSPAGALTRLGAAAAERVAGETVATKALQGAIQAGIEGTGFGLGNNITRSVLNDDPFTVESVAASMTLGGVLGGVTGGALGGAAGAFSRRALNKAKPLAATTPVEDMATGLRTVSSKTDDLVAEYRAVSPGVEGLAPELKAEISRAGSIAGKHGRGIQLGRAEREIFAENAGRGDFPYMRDVLLKGKRTPSAGAIADDAVVQQFRAAEKGLRRELGADLDIAQVLSASAPRARAIAEHLDDYVKAVTAMDDKLGQRFGTKLDIGEEALGRKLSEAGITLPEMSTGQMAQALGKGGNAAFLTKIEAMSPQARMLVQAREMAKATGAAAVAERLGLSNQILNGVGGFAAPLGRLALRRGLGAVTGGALGYHQGGGWTGAAAGAVGGMITAKLPALAGKAVKALANRTAAKGITAGSILAVTSFGSEKDKDPARARMKEIAAAVTNSSTQHALRAATLPISLQNPAVAEKVQAALQARLAFLYNASPYRPPMKGLRMTKEEAQPSSYETAKWARMVRAAENPMSVLEDLANKQITPEAINTVKTLYPELFTRMQVAVMEKVGEVPGGLPYQARLQLSVFFDVPLDASQSPEFGATIQGLYSGQSAGQQSAPPSASMPQGTPKSIAGTQTQRLTMPQ
jgi:hypothetical protein